MSILAIVFAVLTVSLLGGILGIGLAIAARFFGLKKDANLERVTELLPQLNCGACGFAGCAAYASALIKGDVASNLCLPGGHELAQRLAQLLGQELSETISRQVTQVHCRGGRDEAVYRFNYRGIRDCTALYLLGGGNKECRWGCLGQGSCIEVCPVEAISFDGKGLVWVDKDKCIGCGKCIEVCPTKVMRFIPYTADYLVACNSYDPGYKVRGYCKVGCTGCKICEKRSPEGGFSVVDNLSTIDYKARGSRKEAAQKCPPKCIIENKLS